MTKSSEPKVHYLWQDQAGDPPLTRVIHFVASVAVMAVAIVVAAAVTIGSEVAFQALIKVLVGLFR